MMPPSMRAGRKEGSALFARLGAKILAIQAQQIEGIEDQPPACASIYVGPKRVKIRPASIEDKPFEVCDHQDAAGQRQNISSARHAAEWLLYKWPSEIDTAKACAARKACLEVLRADARRQPLARLSRDGKEAGILLGDDCVLIPKAAKRRR
jgi:hypothetical protein